MTFKPILRNCSFSLFAWKEKLTGVNYLLRLILRARFTLSSLALIIMVASCTTPHIQPTDTKLLFNSELLGFIQDGITTREEVVLKLGTPSAQFEGEKILTYQLRIDQAGNRHLVAPQINTSTGFRAWREETCSLVLVFGSDGVLRKHNIVEAK
jgi:outer membrane protein assembly factor BamE (lipoprotein component of BamABCDE complex)